MRTGKRRSAEMIMSRAWHAVFLVRSSQRWHGRLSLPRTPSKPQPSNLLALKHGRLGEWQDGVPRVGRYRSVQPLIPYHVHRIETVAHPLDLLAQCVPQHRNARVGRREVFEGMHRDRALTLLRLEIIGLALTLFVCSRQDRTRSDLLDRICSGPPAVLQPTIFERPGNDAQAGHMLVVDRNRPGELGATLLALRRRAGLADIGDKKSIRHDAFRVAHETIAVWQILDHPIANAERSVFETDLGSTLHQRSLELVAADHLVKHQQMPWIDDILIVLEPVAVFDKADGILAP